MARSYAFAEQGSQHLDIPAREVRLIDYAPAFLAALLKDTLDLGLGWLPGMSFLLSICFDFLILLLLGRCKLSYRQKLITLFGLGLVDSVPVMSFLPVQTLAVYRLYKLDKRAAQEEAKGSASHLNKQLNSKALFEA